MKNIQKDDSHVDEARVKRLAKKIKKRIVGWFSILLIPYLALLLFQIFAQKEFVSVWFVSLELTLVFVLFLIEIFTPRYKLIRDCFVNEVYDNRFFSFGTIKYKIILSFFPILLAFAVLLYSNIVGFGILLALGLVPHILFKYDKTALHQDITYGKNHVQEDSKIEGYRSGETSSRLIALKYLMFVGDNIEPVLKRQYIRLKKGQQKKADQTDFINVKELMRD